MSSTPITATILSKGHTPSLACSVVLAPFAPFLIPVIAGQNVSKTTSTVVVGEELYAAATAPAAFWASGTRFIAGSLVEYSGVTPGTAQASVVVVTSDNQQVIAGYAGSNNWVFTLQNSGGTVGSVTVSGGPTAIPCIGVDPVTRNVTAYLSVAGTPTQVTSGPFAPAGAADGWATGSAIFTGVLLAFGSNGTQSMTLITDHESLPALPGDDWCGNEIG